MTTTRLGKVTTETEARAEVFREAITMVLYVSVVEMPSSLRSPRNTSRTDT